MRQRYLISREDAASDLTIREYAVIGKDLRKTRSSIPLDDDYALLYQENYESTLIKVSISKGIDALIATLRTDNLFPIEPYAAKIAESVMALYRSSDDHSAELFFDDAELFVVG